MAADGRTLEAILAEIHNTPWGEEYLRALDARGSHRTPTAGTSYSAGQGVPRLAVHADGHRLRLALHRAGRAPGGPDGKRPARGARSSRPRLDLRAQPLTGGNLAGALLRWPFMTGKVVAAIYWQALRLKLKGVPFCPHPEQLDVRKGSYHPMNSNEQTCSAPGSPGQCRPGRGDRPPGPARWC